MDTFKFIAHLREIAPAELMHLEVGIVTAEYRVHDLSLDTAGRQPALTVKLLKFGTGKSVSASGMKSPQK
jgi:hypothetical protein